MTAFGDFHQQSQITRLFHAQQTAHKCSKLHVMADIECLQA